MTSWCPEEPWRRSENCCRIRQVEDFASRLKNGWINRMLLWDQRQNKQQCDLAVRRNAHASYRASNLWIFNQPFFTVLGGLTSLLMLSAAIYTIYLILRGIIPVWIRLGKGLSKRKIAVFAIVANDPYIPYVIDFFEYHLSIPSSSQPDPR